MEEKTIKKNQLNNLLEKLKKEYKIFAPTEKDGIFGLYDVSLPDSYQFPFESYKNTNVSSKEMLFPQSEVLFEFQNRQIKSEEFPTQKNILFGIRPCDAQAISFLDEVFINEKDKELIDPYYSTKRENTIIFSLACTNPQVTCFCTSMNSKPDDESGSDIILFDLGEDIIIKPITEKGNALILNINSDLSDTTKAHLDIKNKLIDSSIKKITSKINIENTKEKLDKSFDEDFWKSFRQKCLGCGVCTFLCPTCHCFDISDEMETGMEAFVSSKGSRLKCWDSCMFSLFTLHASGHNPRPTQKERFRQRVMHKFNYCPSNFSKTFCVGCGRCIRSCPVNLDIREVINIVNE